MAQLPKHIATGAAGAARATTTGGKFKTNFFWKAGEKRYLQFITEFNDIVGIGFHIVNAGRTRKGGVKMENFVDPREWFDDPNADNALTDKGWLPKPKRVAIAVEVEPIMGTKNGRKVPVGWEPAMRTFTSKTRGEVSVPNVGVLVNTQTLFAHIDSYYDDNGTILDAVFSITRNGGDQNTSYSVHSQKGDPVELTDEIVNEIDMAEYLEGLADSRAIRALVESLPDDWEYDFSKRPNTSSEPTTNTEDEEDGPEDEVEDRQSAFNNLRADYDLKATIE